MVGRLTGLALTCTGSPARCYEARTVIFMHPVRSPRACYWGFSLVHCTQWDAGEGTDDMEGLCSYGCGYGFCPIQNYTCTATGPLNVPPAANTSLYGFTLDPIQIAAYVISHVSETTAPPRSVRRMSEMATEGAQVAQMTTLIVSSFASLSSELSSLEDFCLNYYALGILANMLNTTMTNYTNILSSHGGKFTEYQKYIREEVLDVLTAYMDPRRCPFEVEQLYNGYDIHYDPINATAFWTNLSATTGDVGSSCGVGTGQTCQPDKGILKGYPLPADTITVTNPQTIIEDARPGIQNLTETIMLTQILAATGAYGGSMTNVLLIISTVVFTLAQAVANMDMVVEVADKASEEEKKAMIEEIIFGVLMVVPFLGEIRLISDSLEQLADMMSLIGDVGALGSTIYGVATDPDSAILDIFEIALMGSCRDPDEFEEAANARRGLTDDEISSLGSDWKSWSDDLSDVMSSAVEFGLITLRSAVSCPHKLFQASSEKRHVLQFDPFYFITDTLTTKLDSKYKI
ncbi:hypothetical protein BO71DRAFT_439197 [Aspergillus ellipticus CBS 707.79]|uniref:Uncharacterized protein n=1 Tax=Aspergillus ellipticus CBS 707.79 TaxID=1448320 RepID=A0A319DJ39_9EURO|nr:hypothetical protein BO71DRAFT_439197 [Aspergillus ellipticus CBS 707.79]